MVFCSELTMNNPLNVYSRARQMFGGDNRSFLAPASFGQSAYVDEFQHLQSTAAAAAAAASANHLRLFAQCNAQFLSAVAFCISEFLSFPIALPWDALDCISLCARAIFFGGS